MKKAGGSNSPNGEEGMLEYIEDIVGSNRFKPYIDNVQTGLDRIADERLDLLERVKVYCSLAEDLNIWVISDGRGTQEGSRGTGETGAQVL